MIEKASIIKNGEMQSGQALLAEGAALQKSWPIGSCAFLKEHQVASEFEYKQQQSALGNIMQHAHIGFRDPQKTIAACAEIYERCAAKNVRIDRYGLCLDWSMGYPLALRQKIGASGTGIMLQDVEQFCELTQNSPVAPHFGDFMLGFPGSLENTQGALSAGATALGNLGQYFTFRLPGWDDDIATTEATVKALGLIAAQPQTVLVHSNIDDGFGAQFSDLACCLGAVMIERYIVEELIGGTMAHCYGHHFSDPLTRLAFQRALQKTKPSSGTMIFGATVTYKGDTAANFASLGSYLLADIVGQKMMPTGHAINPVPVTENIRIPDVEEIIAAQTFAANLVEQGSQYTQLISLQNVEAIAQQIFAGAEQFKQRVLQGLQAGGFDINDPAEMLLALRRIGARRLEQMYGPGLLDRKSPNGRKPIVTATTYVELEEQAEIFISGLSADYLQKIAAGKLRCMAATSDVHEHAKVLLTLCYDALGIEVLEGGISTDAQTLAMAAAQQNVDFIALSTYNGVALNYYNSLRAQLQKLHKDIPIFIGGRLNQISHNSINSLPEDVSAQLTELGANVCKNMPDSLQYIEQILQDPQRTILSA
ncbi:MAG: hypothetical protein V7784_15670 [Oceanospirillaceae bacterium]